MDLLLSRLQLIFNIPESNYSAEQIHAGHINHTFKISATTGSVYILQKLNGAIFHNIKDLMSNFQLVTDTINNFNLNSATKIEVPLIIETRSGQLFYTDENQNHWRLITFIKGIDNKHVTVNSKTAYEGGQAFGMFLRGVSALNHKELNVIIPDFHSLEYRFKQFQQALENNLAKRAAAVQSEIEFIESWHSKMVKIPHLIATGKIPVRITHNDTKLTNVVFSEKLEAIGVIDLDTVMPGSALYDFGDAIRTLTNRANEDEPEIEKVHFDISLFKSFSEGYIKSTASILCHDEIENFTDSALLMTYIIGLRFFTDYLNGDTYYQIHHPEHNLVRARVQFRLLSQMSAHHVEMQEIIRTIASRHFFPQESFHPNNQEL